MHFGKFWKRFLILNVTSNIHMIKYVLQERSILDEDLTWIEIDILFASLEINKLVKLFPVYKVCNCSDSPPLLQSFSICDIIYILFITRTKVPRNIRDKKMVLLMTWSNTVVLHRYFDEAQYCGQSGIHMASRHIEYNLGITPVLPYSQADVEENTATLRCFDVI